MDILVHYATIRSNALEAYKVTHAGLENSVKFKVNTTIWIYLENMLLKYPTKESKKESLTTPLFMLTRAVVSGKIPLFPPL